jgi:SRSO17 transposase
MTQIPGVLAQKVGNLYANRTWIEYGFRQIKSKLGWADSDSRNIHTLKKGGKLFVVLT